MYFFYKKQHSVQITLTQKDTFSAMYASGNLKVRYNKTASCRRLFQSVDKVPDQRPGLCLHSEAPDYSDASPLSSISFNIDSVIPFELSTGGNNT